MELRRCESSGHPHAVVPRTREGRAGDRCPGRADWSNRVFFPNRWPGRGSPNCSSSDKASMTRNQGRFDHSSTASTSATNRPASSLRNAATTLNTASLKPPTFRMSLRSGACVVVYGCRSMQTSFGRVVAQPLLVGDERLPLGHHARRALLAVAEGTTCVHPALVVADQHAAGKPPLGVLAVGRSQRQRAVRATATVLGQPLRQAQDRVAADRPSPRTPPCRTG